MLEAIEKLLILQDRDRRILRTRAELHDIEPQRQAIQAQTGQSQAALDAAKLKAKQIETERKKLELEVESQKQAIEKYSIQQFQTKKNEEYRALGHQIETCKQNINRIEDQMIELMEQAEAAQKVVAAAERKAKEAKETAESRLASLSTREASLKKQLAEYEANRGELAAGVEEGVLSRYERLLKHKGGNVVVGVNHGVCGGCHMKLPVQAIISCQGHKEIVTCPNCARILYHTRDMDMAVSE